ncbi:glutamate-rich protein 3, partial [Poecile atricapillus]
MSAPQPRFLATYNSLTDKHLVGYFSNARIRRHLQKAGLISRSGRIIPEKEYRLNAMRRDHQRDVQECLADAIFQKVLDMERHHQLETKRSLECSVRKERMQPIKVEQFRASLENVIRVHCPHPPLTPRSHHGLGALVAAERPGRSQWRTPGLGVDCGGGHCPRQHRTKKRSSWKVSSLRPNAAPGNIQQPPLLQPLHGWAAAGSVPKASKQKCHAHDQQFPRGGERSELSLLNSVEYVSGVSPCQLPLIHSCVVPVPPPRLRRGHRRVPPLRTGLPMCRRFHPTTAFNEQILIKNTRGYPKSPLCSNALVTMIYLGKSRNVSLCEYMDEIKIFQQHCGTENICVYKGELFEGDTFQFTSKRHLGFPFSLTCYLNGLQVDRLSSCCEYRYQSRSQVRARSGYFRVLHVAGAPPCYRCILAMGLDKKLFPPKRKTRYQDGKHVCCWGSAVHSEPCVSSIGQKSKDSMSMSVTTRGREASVGTLAETLKTGEESSEEEMENQSCQESEDSQDDTSINEYDEDFEADEEFNEEGQTGDQMNGMSESSSDDKNHNLDYGKESETSSQKALQASDSEKNESDGYSDDKDSEDDQQERRPADSLSSMSTQCSTETDSHAEMVTEDVNGKEDWNIKGTSDRAAHAHYGNGNGEKKLLRMEENQEISAVEEKGIDEAEKTKPGDLTAREDTRIFHENIMAMQHQNPEVNGEFKQPGSGDNNLNEEEKKYPLVPWEGRVLKMEDGKEESPRCEEGGVSEDCKLVQEEIEKTTGNDHPVNSEPEPGDSCANEEEKSAANTEHDASGAAADGSFLAEGRRSLDVQEAAGQAGQVAGQGRAPEQDGAAEGDDGRAEAEGKAARAEDSLPEAGTGAALEESAAEEGAVAEEHPSGKGAGEVVKLGTEVSPGEQRVLVEGMEREVALGAAGGEGPAGALPGWEADRAMPQGQEGAVGITEEEEEAADEGLRGAVGLPAEEEMGEPGCGESFGQGGSAGKDTVVGAVSEAEEAVEEADVAADGMARAVDPEGEEAITEDISEGEEAMGNPGALWEALGDVETGEAMPGGEGFVKPSEFSQLKGSGEEWMEMGKAIAGAAALESAQAWEVGGNALQIVEDTTEKTLEAEKGPVLQVAPGLGALGGVWGDPVTKGSSQVEETPAAQEEGAAGALRGANSKAEAEGAAEGKPEGEAVVGGSAEAAGAGSGGEEVATDGAAGSEEPAARTEGWLRCGEARRKGRTPGEALGGERGLCGTRAGEPGLVAIAVLGGLGALARGPAVGTGAMAQEGVTGAALGTQGGTGAQEV